MKAQRYPLSWPTGWKRARTRQRAKFHGTTQRPGYNGNMYRQNAPLTIGQGLERLRGEMKRLGVRDQDWLMSSDLKLNLDGSQRANQAMPSDPGVAIYFRLAGNDRVLACDTWDRIPDNIAAIAAHVECLRGIDRYGVGTLEQAFTGYAALPPKGSTWRTTLGFAPEQSVTLDDVDAAYRHRSRTAHPDVQGGSQDAMASLNLARDEARSELGGVR